jgi:hypothetical protein
MVEYDEDKELQVLALCQRKQKYIEPHVVVQ